MLNSFSTLLNDSSSQVSAVIIRSKSAKTEIKFDSNSKFEYGNWGKLYFGFSSSILSGFSMISISSIDDLEFELLLT